MIKKFKLFLSSFNQKNSASNQSDTNITFLFDPINIMGFLKEFLGSDPYRSHIHYPANEMLDPDPKKITLTI